MKPKYSDGTKVSIRTRDPGRQLMFPDLKKYENLTGKVLSSTEVVAYFVQPATYSVEPYAGRNSTLLVLYTVELEIGVTLHDLTEYYLEEFH